MQKSGLWKPGLVPAGTAGAALQPSLSRERRLQLGGGGRFVPGEPGTAAAPAPDPRGPQLPSFCLWGAGSPPPFPPPPSLANLPPGPARAHEAPRAGSPSSVLPESPPAHRAPPPPCPLRTPPPTSHLAAALRRAQALGSLLLPSPPARESCLPRMRTPGTPGPLGGAGVGQVFPLLRLSCTQRSDFPCAASCRHARAAHPHLAPTSDPGQARGPLG